LHRHPAPLNSLGGDPEVLVIETSEASKRIAGEDWHSDVSCDGEPPLGSILHLRELPLIGGDTLFASMYAAYEGLSDPLQRFLTGLTAVHDGARNYAGRTLARPGEGNYPSAEHPVVRTHPETGRKALFLNRPFTTRIVQLKQGESNKIRRYSSNM
jgi:taurine dioxygenase